MSNNNWYAELNKPSWSPPAWLFGPVWGVLYILIAITFGRVFVGFFQEDLSWSMVLPFILNIIFNLLFTPLQLKLRNNLLAALDSLLIAISLVWAIVIIAPQIAWVAYLNIPYLLWVCFATVLQLEIARLNR